VLEIAQQLLNGKWRHATAALEACQRGDWADFVRRFPPPRPLLIGRLDYRRCLALAEASLRGPETTTLTLVPLWACSTFETEANQWVAVNGVAQEGQPLYVHEPGPFVADESPLADALWKCTVRRWQAASVVDSHSYAPGVPLQLRAGAFGVLDIHVDEVLSVEVNPTEPLPRPTREVPMFASWFEPRVRVPAELESQIAAMCSREEAE
jgi:hypothetical protein